MKTAIASWQIELTVECPYCNEYQGDVLDSTDDWLDVYGEIGAS